MCVEEHTLRNQSSPSFITGFINNFRRDRNVSTSSLVTGGREIMPRKALSSVGRAY